MNREQLRKKIRGTPVTLVTPFDNNMKVDFGRMSEMTQWWVEQGLGTNDTALKTSAAMGEGPDLSDDEWPQLLSTVVEASGGDKTIICGLKAKNTLHTIEDAKRAQDLGAIGLQIDLPFFHHSNQDDLVRHFSDISDAIEVGVMIYNTHWFCQNPQNEYMQADTLLKLKDTEHIVTIKWGVPQGEDYDQMRRFSTDFNVIDNTGQWVRCYKNGGSGYISSLIAVYPPHDLEIRPLLEQGKYEEAQKKIDRVNTALKDWSEKAHSVSGGYRLGKGMLAALGRPVGPTRPPTLPCTEQEISEIKTIFEELGWR